MRTLEGKTLFITGGSRGIGLAIAVRAARDGARIAIAAKTVEPHPKLTGTIHTAASAIDQAGGTALPIACDIRDETAVRAAVDATVARFGGIDILVNNASAISLTGTLATPIKRFDLMFGVNVRGHVPLLADVPAAPQGFRCRREESAMILTPRRRSTWTRSGSATTSPTRWRNTG